MIAESQSNGEAQEVKSNQGKSRSVVTTLPRSAMAPKRARTAAAASASASSSSQSAGATTKLTLHGGVPHHPALAGLWRDERLTDYRSLISKSSSGTAPVSFSARRRSPTR